MGYHLNHLDDPVLIAVSKPLPTEFGIHHRLESCGSVLLMSRYNFSTIINESTDMNALSK